MLPLLQPVPYDLRFYQRGAFTNAGALKQAIGICIPAYIIELQTTIYMKHASLPRPILKKIMKLTTVFHL